MYQIKHKITGAVLWEKDIPHLRGAYLRGANLVGAYLVGAYLAGANLVGANLAGADLRGANLSGANLAGANLRGAYLVGAYLVGANLAGADLAGADLRGADLRGADLHGADLRGAKNAELSISRTVIVPQGTLIVWKKLGGGIIAKLRIPEKARRSNANGRKCRAEYAKVLELSKGTRGKSLHDSDFIYEVGKTVRCDTWCKDRWQECAGGIHFYLTREEAEAH